MTLSDDVLDQHLSPGALTSGEPTVHPTSVIDQAIGVLVGRRSLPDHADGELTERAENQGTDRYVAAHQGLASLTPGADPTHRTD